MYFFRLTFGHSDPFCYDILCLQGMLIGDDLIWQTFVQSSVPVPYLYLDFMDCNLCATL